MSEWTVKVPGNEHKLTTEELKLWAEGGKVKGDTIVVDSRGEHWTAKQIPGVFSKRDWLVALILSVLVGTLWNRQVLSREDRHRDSSSFLHLVHLASGQLLTSS